MDILEAGPQGTPRQRTFGIGLRRASMVVAAALAGVMALGFVQWWMAMSSRPQRITVIAIERSDSRAVALMEPPAAVRGAAPPGWPTEWDRATGLPSVMLRVTVTGDPQRDSTLEPAGTGVGGVVSALGASPPLIVPAGETLTFDLTAASDDCSSPARFVLLSGGTPVDMSAGARSNLAQAMSDVCAPGGERPQLRLDTARIETFFRDRTLVGTAVGSPGESGLVLLPMDSLGLRGIGSAVLESSTSVRPARIRWLVSPGELPTGPLQPTVRAFRIVDGTAYPWTIHLDLPAGFAIDATDGQRNDGVDLAEVAPRPSD